MTFFISVPAAHLLEQIQIRSSVDVAWEESEISIEFRDSWDRFKVIFAVYEILKASPWLTMFCWHISGLKAERQSRGLHGQKAPTEEDSHVNSYEFKLLSSRLLPHLPRNSLRKDSTFKECEIYLSLFCKRYVISVSDSISKAHYAKFKQKSSSAW